jgi:hypothetical protein
VLIYCPVPQVLNQKFPKRIQFFRGHGTIMQKPFEIAILCCNYPSRN